MEDPAHPNYPQKLLNVVGPRNMVHSWATAKDDPTEMPRWGKIGKQRIEDAGPLYPKRMETVDDEIRDLAINFMDKAKKDGKPFFVWLNSTRMHIVTDLLPKYEAMRNSENGWSEEEAGMAQLDDDVGLVMKKIKTWARTIIPSSSSPPTTAPKSSTWPDGGQTPFGSQREQYSKAVSACPRFFAGQVMCRLTPVQNGLFSGLDWLPTFVAAAGNPNIIDELLKGKTIGDRTYKNHLDGYNQMAAITGKGPSARHRDFLSGARARSVRCALTTISSASSTSPLAGWAKRPTRTCLILRIALDRFRACGLAERWDERRRAAVLRLVQVPILALRVRPASNWQGNPDLPRLPADAARRELQS